MRSAGMVACGGASLALLHIYARALPPIGAIGGVAIRRGQSLAARLANHNLLSNWRRSSGQKKRAPGGRFGLCDALPDFVCLT